MSEQETLPATDTRPPCAECGASMEGEHHKRKFCSTCKPPSSGRRKRRKKPEPSVSVSSSVSATAVADPLSRPPSGAIKVKIDDLPPLDEDDSDVHEYWVGTIQGFAIQNVTVGGVTFPRFCGTPSFEWDEEKGEMRSDQPIIPGALMKLTDRQVDFIADDVTKYIVRWVGTKGPKRAILLDRAKREEGKLVPDHHYSPVRGDVPLAKYIYMVRTDSMDFHSRTWEEAERMTMLQE